MLSQAVPNHPDHKFSASMKTAAGISSDCYDFHLAIDGMITFALEEATGHSSQADTHFPVKNSFDSRAFLIDETRSPSRMLPMEYSGNPVGSQG